MPELRNKLKSGAITGIKRGWHSFIWMLKIFIPVSLVVTLLQWAGWLNEIYFL